MKSTGLSRWMLGAAAGVWLSLVVAGLCALAAYAGRAGESGTQPEHWPAESAVSPDSRLWTLVLILHPRCGCSRATVEELNRLMVRCEDRLAVRVLVVRPPGAERDWEKADLWKSAAAIPGVMVQTDVDGIEARRFGASTSGQSVLYDPSGRMRFRGGLTASRGHEGDNAGCDAIAALVNGGSAVASSTAVFGCSLFGDEAGNTQSK